jgi:hypothetical protein
MKKLTMLQERESGTEGNNLKEILMKDQGIKYGKRKHKVKNCENRNSGKRKPVTIVTQHDAMKTYGEVK